MFRLDSIAELQLVKIPRFKPDSFQLDIQNKLHLEFFLQKCRVLITPDHRYLLTGPAGEDEIAHLQAAIAARQETLQWLKEYLVYQLSLYSSLIESNSYYISLNENLIITRFVDVPDHPEEFEVKLYTIGERDLPHNYRDKIYIGRDFLPLTRIHREHFGLKHIRNSMEEQIAKLSSRFDKFIEGPDRSELQKEFVEEFAELIADFREEADYILEHFPVDISPRSLDHNELTDANRRFRSLKHILMELEESARELESVMFDRNLSRAVRYAVKYRKDRANYINYFMLKVNGRITDAVNGFHV